MSIYRTIDRCPRSDVHASEVEHRRLALVPPAKASQIRPEQLDGYQHLRKATPANRAFPRTLVWVETLPRDIRPTALLRRYPRIANLVATVWGDPKYLHTYLESLLTDQRGNRRGFPPDVLADLVSLQRYYETAIGNPQGGWNAVGKRG
jgi:hypothetical protein